MVRKLLNVLLATLIFASFCFPFSDAHLPKAEAANWTVLNSFYGLSVYQDFSPNSYIEFSTPDGALGYSAWPQYSPSWSFGNPIVNYGYDYTKYKYRVRVDGKDSSGTNISISNEFNSNPPTGYVGPTGSFYPGYTVNIFIERTLLNNPPTIAVSTPSTNQSFLATSQCKVEMKIANIFFHI